MADARAPLVVLSRDDLEELLERAVQRGRELGSEPEWLTADQVAELLDVTRETVVTYARREDLPCRYAGRTPMFRRSEVYEWIDSRDRRARSSPRRGTLRAMRGGKR